MNEAIKISFDTKAIDNKNESIKLNENDAGIIINSYKENCQTIFIVALENGAVASLRRAQFDYENEFDTRTDFQKKLDRIKNNMSFNIS